MPDYDPYDDPFLMEDELFHEMSEAEERYRRLYPGAFDKEDDWAEEELAVVRPLTEEEREAERVRAGQIQQRINQPVQELTERNRRAFEEAGKAAEEFPGDWPVF